MTFNKTYFIYLGFVVGLPTLATALMSKPVWWTLAVFILTNLLALVLSIFHLLFRGIGDKSDSSKLNTAVRLRLTEKNAETVLKRIFPDENLNSLIATGREVAQTLLQLGRQDNKTFNEAEARTKNLIAIFIS